MAPGDRIEIIISNTAGNLNGEPSEKCRNEVSTDRAQ